MSDGETIECVVAPDCTVYGEHPSGVPGAPPLAYESGQTLRLTPTEAERLRVTGHLLMANGTKTFRII